MHGRLNQDSLKKLNKIIVLVSALTFLSMGTISCQFFSKKNDEDSHSSEQSAATNSTASTNKTGASDCQNPDLNKLAFGERVTLCDGSIGTGSLRLNANDILTGVTYAGIDGTMLSSNGTCNNSTFINCETTSDFRATESATLAAKVLNTEIIAGIQGTAPVAGSADPWDIRYGVTVDTVTGKLKINCRNMVNTGTHGAVDADSTIDDWNDPNAALPSENPWTDENFCGFNLPIDATFQRVVTNPATSGSSSVFEDKVSGQRWTRGTTTTTHTWTDALSYCSTTLNNENAGSGHGGIDNWRLPTLKELNQAYLNGIFDLDSTLTSTDHLNELETTFWSSTTDSTTPTNAFRINMSSAFTNTSGKGGSERALCVSDT